VLGDGEGRETRVAVLLGTGRKVGMVHGFGLLGRQTEQEILGEAGAFSTARSTGQVKRTVHPKKTGEGCGF
jgi:hypothetical protein